MYLQKVVKYQCQNPTLSYKISQRSHIITPMITFQCISEWEVVSPSEKYFRLLRHYAVIKWEVSFEYPVIFM